MREIVEDKAVIPNLLLTRDNFIFFVGAGDHKVSRKKCQSVAERTEFKSKRIVSLNLADNNEKLKQLIPIHEAITEFYPF